MPPQPPQLDEFWKVDFGPPQPGQTSKLRPALLIGPAYLNANSECPVIVIPATTAHRDFRAHIHVDNTPGTGLEEPSYLQCEHITTVPRRCLMKRLGAAGPETTCNVRGELRWLLGIPAPVAEDEAGPQS